jgi:hypothetical protein
MTIHGNVTSTTASFAFSGTSQGLDAIKRAVGCMMLMSLSTDGADEAWKALCDIWEFHAPAAAGGLPRFVSDSLQGRTVAASERLPLLFDESGE